MFAELCVYACVFDVCVLQSNWSHDVLSSVPSGHLCSSAGVCCLLGNHRLVSFCFVKMFETVAEGQKHHLFLTPS